MRYTRSGVGESLEAGIRVAKSGVILGGSEEIMNDLAIKLSFRLMPSLWLSYYS